MSYSIDLYVHSALLLTSNSSNDSKHLTKENIAAVTAFKARLPAPEINEKVSNTRTVCDTTFETSYPKPCLLHLLVHYFPRTFS